MIKDYACTDTELLFNQQRVRRFVNIETAALRKLAQLAAATSLDFLRVLPGNRLEALSGNRKGQHSIRINNQWRICFVWKDNSAHQVEIVATTKRKAPT